MWQWFKWVLLSIVALALIFFGLVFMRNKGQQNGTGFETNKATNEARPVFTKKMFDPAKVESIMPMGELNGGYVETQTINGVVINVKRDSNGVADPIEIYAPADMTFEDYSYFPDPRAPDRPTQWHLGFRISRDMKLSFDHISWVPDNIKEVTPPTKNSGYVPPTKKLTFKAGDLIAKSSGTREANNWNIYLRDNKKSNTFVNQARYEKVRENYSYVNAVCPFDYHEETIKQEFLALMGYYEAGQSKTCGSNSQDVKGSISGMWHLNKEGMLEDYEGQYATPFSIYKTSANEVIIYEIDRKRFILGATNETYKDPATITDSHCYNLTEYGNDRTTKGYAYFRVDSDTEMSVVYSATGSCPAEFPANDAKKYYR